MGINFQRFINKEGYTTQKKPREIFAFTYFRGNHLSIHYSQKKSRITKRKTLKENLKEEIKILKTKYAIFDSKKSSFIIQKHKPC